MQKLKIEFQSTRKGKEKLFVDGKETQVDTFDIPLISSEIAGQIPVRKIPDGFTMIVSGVKSGNPFDICLKKFDGIKFLVNIHYIQKLNMEMSEKEYHDRFIEAIANKDFVIALVPYEGFERPSGIAFMIKSWTVSGMLNECHKIMDDLISKLN